MENGCITFHLLQNRLPNSIYYDNEALNMENKSKFRPNPKLQLMTPVISLAFKAL